MNMTEEQKVQINNTMKRLLEYMIKCIDEGESIPMKKIYELNGLYDIREGNI